MQKDLTVIIVTYNSKDVIGKCLINILSDSVNVTVVDNASTDGTIDFVMNNFPEVKIISSSQNIGFGRGCNLGIKDAATQYILLLNPDVITSSGAIENLLYSYKKLERPAILAPRTRKDKMYDSKKLHEKHDWVSGAAMLFEKEMINKIGGFDEKIFLFSEEVDLCARARKAGYDVLIANEIYMDHMVGGSSSFNPKISYLKYWHMGWGRAYYDNKHEETITYIKNTSVWISKYAMKLLLNSVTGNRTKVIKYKGLLAGSVSFILGRSAFDATGKPRGI